MNTASSPRGPIDTMLGVVLRLLLVALFTLAGAWAATAASSQDGNTLPGGAIGFVFITICLLKEKSVEGFCRAHGAALYLTGLLIYLVFLGFATYSELFDLGWFNWLSL
jgi:hypothetical protein